MPPIAGREAYAKEMTQFTIKVGHLGLRAAQNADAQIAQAVQVLSQEPQRGTFAHARIACDQSEAALADLLFDAPAEALDLGWRPEGGDRCLGGEGIKLQAIEIKQSFVHEGFFGGWG